MRRWQLQEAKNKFSEVARRAVSDGPQMVTKRGEDNVVVISVRDYQRSRTPQISLVDFLRSSPLAETDITIERNRDTGREIDL